MPQKGQGLGTDGTCAKDNSEGSGVQKPKRSEEYISFQTLIHKQTQTLLFLSICVQQTHGNILCFYCILEELLRSFFIIIAAWKLGNTLLSGKQH